MEKTTNETGSTTLIALLYAFSILPVCTVITGQLTPLFYEIPNNARLGLWISIAGGGVAIALIVTCIISKVAGVLSGGKTVLLMFVGVVLVVITLVSCLSIIMTHLFMN